MFFNVENLSYGILKKSILRNVNIKVTSGNILALVGPNGSGKTTTLKCISSILTDYNGKIYVERSDQNSFNYTKIMLFDNPIMYDSLLGKENLELVIKLSSRRIDDNYLSDLLNILNMNDKLHLPYANYSLGMKKKLYLIAALIQEPDILILDEFISGLDPIALTSVKEVLTKYAKKDKIIILSTHMLDTAEKFCTQIVLINEGVSFQPHESIQEILSTFNSLEDYYLHKTNQKSFLNNRMEGL